MIIRRSIGTAIACGIALVIATLIGGSALVLERTRQTALHAADATLQNAGVIVESVVNRQLLQVDAALVSLPALLAALGPNAQDINSPAASRMLHGFNFQTFAFRDIILLREDGAIWASARPNPWNRNFPVDLLRAHATNPGATASVAGPARNPVTGDWVLLVVRRVQVTNVGMLFAVAEVPLPLITELFSAIGDIPGITITLQRQNGQILVNQPYNERQIGEIQQGGIDLTKAEGGTFMLPQSQMHAPTLAVARASLYPDVMVVLTLDLKTALADWTRDRYRLIIVVAIAVILLSVMTMILTAALRQRERAAAERSRARATLDSAIEAMSDAFVMWDSDDRLVTCNKQYRAMYNLSDAFIRPGARFEDIVRSGALNGQYPEATADIDTFVSRTVAWHRHNKGPMERELPGGRWALVTEQHTADGGIVGIRTDITDLKRALANLAAANERAQLAMQEVQQQNVALTERDRTLHIQNVLFDAALNNISQGLLMTDGDGRLIVYNKRFLDLFGMQPEAVSSGIPVSEIFASMKASGELPVDTVENTYMRQLSLAECRHSATFIVTGEQGRAISISQRPIADGGWIATYEDVSEQRRAEEHIRFVAHHDVLTKLPNRILFRLYLDELITNLAHRTTGVALLYLNLDRFKHINDTLGHSVGDALLEAAGRRLRGCLRGRDIVARLGGDEFAIAYVSAELPKSAALLAERVISTLSAPYSLEGHTVTIGASVGIALVGSEEIDADTLLKRGDMALYQAKAKGRGIWSLFEADMERQLVSRLAIEEDLHGALQAQQFQVLYQPLYDLNTDRITGFESLIRWHHPVRGIVPPSQFIQIAEETGLIHSIGAWVLNRACQDAMKLPTDVRVAVNLSARQFDNDDIFDIVAGALETSGLPANRLELEVTETTLLKNNELTLALLFRLRGLGLRIALDDFGTGYSSLTYLRLFPFDKIKIDQSFVREMATRADCAAIVSSIATMANKLNITTTAEGIETIDQLNLIRETGCTEAQGYLFSVPRPCQDILDYFAGSSNALATFVKQSAPSLA